MKQIDSLSLNKKVIASLQGDEMSQVEAGNMKLYLTDTVIISINTRQTNVQSCCGGDCAYYSCHPTNCD